MKLWEVLKNVNEGKMYKDNKDRKFRLALNINECPILVAENTNIAWQIPQEDIMTLRFEEYVEPNKTAWDRVKPNDIYWCITSSGGLDSCIDIDDIFDKMSHKNCNYFSTEEKATEVMNDQLLYRKMLKYRDTHDDKPITWELSDKDNTATGGWRIIYDHLNRKYIVKRSRYLETVGVIYFSSEIVAKDCIREIVVPHYTELHVINK